MVEGRGEFVLVDGWGGAVGGWRRIYQYSKS